jgi:uncharacterized membrane protein YkvA (DUF1232 family)
MVENDRGNRPKKLKRKEKKAVRGRMNSFLMFLPNMVRLLGRLLKDARVPTAEKALFVAAIVYVISPIDLIPDIFPFIGQVDDIYMVALTLLRLINRSDERVVRENWPGGGDIVGLADSIAKLAPAFLPARVQRVLTAKVAIAPTGQIVKNFGKEPVIVEIAEPDIAKASPIEEPPKAVN